ncbi:hypothetical protein COV24_03140 [candidate division WWE3 bacterium CG10_big_fil_rev_8_21_14_0_10_32_10]|uniref:ATP-grasp domain-containing protein n=1 Tax=candidate division WWE3 bacterium CG10_big_fil_rev_8_21_14_0_10_32_10 TaxID=1975090 RepID=A0A2H0R9Z9_UNCKA|nr:MAG: hypothetical protein COV24_03140 [candidate division WWE3 bacterium CG10_big_fil_rev_8_21_14_0_10_32_10]
MKKILILSRFAKEYEPKRLKEEALKLGYEADIVKYGQISFGVYNNKPYIKLPNNLVITDYNYVIPRSSSKNGSSMIAVKNVILQYILELQVPALNQQTFKNYPLLGKIEQGFLMAKSNIPTIDYYSFGSKKGWDIFLQKSNIEFPLIVKGRFGSHGRTVRLVNNIEELKSDAKKYTKDSVLVQPVLPVKQWYRCIVVKNKAGDYEYLGEMRHRQKQKYQHPGFNFIEEKLVKLNDSRMEELKDICIKAATLFDCDYCGIDVLYREDTKQFVISEVNRTAQFKYFEKRTGVNVADKLLSQ